MAIMCKHYAERDPKAKENCVNCLLWIGVQCIDHLTLAQEFETSRKFKELDRLMRSNKGVYLE